MKKSNVFKKSGLGIIGLLAAAAVLAAANVSPSGLSANANSGPSHWNGVTASGAVISGENCPIEVESELLTFEIPQFIEYGSSKEEMLNYSANFSAEYTFKNPTQNAVNATLAFPLGEHSDLGYWENGNGGDTDNFIYLEDLLTEKGLYKVTVDGEQIAAQTRYTFHELNDFDFSTEVNRISEGYREHGFFYREMPVYIYTFSVVSEETDYFQAEATVENADGLRFGGDYGAIEKGKNKITLSYSVRGGKEIKLYSFGGELNTGAIGWEFYKTSGFWGLTIKKVEASAVLSPKEEFEVITFEDYVFKGYSGGNGVSRSDFYNAALDYIDEYFETSMLPKSFDFLENSNYLMRWFVYDLNFSAGQTVKNTVSAPLYSGGKYNYSPWVYTYEYLLSPARNWNSFKSLEIRLITPYYAVNSNLEFEKTDYGYVYKSDGLPDCELEFELCEVENPEHKVNHGYTVLAVILLLMGAAVILVPLAIVIIFIVWVVIRSKKGNADADKNGSNGFKPMNTFDGEK